MLFIPKNLTKQLTEHFSTKCLTLRIIIIILVIQTINSNLPHAFHNTHDIHTHITVQNFFHTFEILSLNMLCGNFNSKVKCVFCICHNEY